MLVLPSMTLVFHVASVCTLRYGCALAVGLCLGFPVRRFLAGVPPPLPCRRCAGGVLSPVPAVDSLSMVVAMPGVFQRNLGSEFVG